MCRAAGKCYGRTVQPPRFLTLVVAVGLACATLDAQRRSPALDPDGAATKRPSMLAEVGARKTRAIVMPHPDLFDPKKPRTSVQLIVLGYIRYQPDLFRQVQAQIDKAALAALFD